MGAAVNLLMVGGGKGGSWAIRGHQLGAALGARVTSDPQPSDWAWADVIVLVKRAIGLFGVAAQQTGKPIVWDALDFWMQPTQNGVDPTHAKRLAEMATVYAWPALTIGATHAMAHALSGEYLPHHAWPGLTPAPARRHVSVVGYQGNAAYLGRWAGWLSDACRVRGWRFVVNPDDVRDVDILTSFRDGPWDGWICRQWKSGVKLVNAMVAGRPVIGQGSAAWLELDPHGSIVEYPENLDAAFDVWSSERERIAAASDAERYARTFHIDTIAARYRGLLEGVTCPA